MNKKLTRILAITFSSLCTYMLHANFEFKRTEELRSIFGQISHLEWSLSDKNYLASALNTDGYHAVHIWDTSEKPKLIAKLEHDDIITSLAWDPHNEKRFATATNKGNIFLWDITKITEPSVIKKIKAHKKSITCLKWSDKGTLASSCGKEIKVWNLKKVSSSTLKGHTDTVTALSWTQSQDTELLASASLDGTVKIWDLSEQKLRTDIHAKNDTGDMRFVWDVAWRPEQANVFVFCTSTQDDTQGTLSICRRDLQTIKTIELEHSPNKIQWHPLDPSIVAISGTIGEQTTIEVWDLHNAQKEEEIMASIDFVQDPPCFAWERSISGQMAIAEKNGTIGLYSLVDNAKATRTINLGEKDAQKLAQQLEKIRQESKQYVPWEKPVHKLISGKTNLFEDVPYNKTFLN